MQLNDFIQIVRTQLEDFTDATYKDETFISWLKLGLADFFAQTKIHKDIISLTLQPTLNNIELEGSTISVDSVFWNNNELERVPFGTVSLSAQGTPSQFALSKQAVFLYPTPNALGTVTVYRTAIPTFDSSDTTVEVPYSTSYAAVLIDFVMMRAFEQLEQFTTCSWYQQKYQDGVEKAISNNFDLTNAGQNYLPQNVY